MLTARHQGREDPAEHRAGALRRHDSVPYLETLSMDPDKDVAQEGIRSLRTLRARLP